MSEDNKELITVNQLINQIEGKPKKEKKEYETLHRYQEEVFSLLTENNQIPTRKNTRNNSTDDDSYDDDKDLSNDELEQ